MERDTRVFASLIMARRSIARVENFSTSRRRSDGLVAGVGRALLVGGASSVALLFDV